MTQPAAGFARRLDDAWAEIQPGDTLSKGYLDEGDEWQAVQIPDLQWLAAFTAEDLAARDVYAFDPVAAPATPPGLQPAPALEDDDGTPVRTWSLDHIEDEALVSALVAAVNVERDARIDGGFTWQGQEFQTRLQDQVNFLALGTIATGLVSSGAAVADDFRWLNPAKDFFFITAANAQVPLDAFGMAALYVAGMTFKDGLTFAARAKKDWLLDPARTREELLSFDIAADWPA